MRPQDLALAIIAVIVWGLAFVAIEFGLEGFSPPQLTAIRYFIGGLPALVLARPPIAWRVLIPVGVILFAGQHLFLFFAFTQGLPPGVASVTHQMQVFFTIILASVFLRAHPTGRQVVAITVGFLGVVLIGSTAGGGGLTLVGLGLGLVGSMCWAIGNVALTRIGGDGSIKMFPLMCWLSLMAPLPALLVSGVYGAELPIHQAIMQASWKSLGAAIYLGLGATTISYGIWGYLLGRYPPATVVPFGFLVPCTGVVASAVILGEAFGPLRLAGMALILGGVAINVFLGRR